MSADIGERFRKGAFWIYLQGWASTVASFGGSIVMARLLEPADFGVFAAVSAYTAILARQLQFGIPEALLRTPEDDQPALHSGFWVMQGLALVCFLAAWLLAPLLARAYADPRFVDLMRLVAVLFLLQPAAFAAQTEIRRRLRHDQAARHNLAASVLAMPAAIGAAAAGAGPYAFVVGGGTAALVLVTLALRRSNWRPRPAFDAARARAVLGYGWRLHAASSLNVAGDRVDAMIIGSAAGTAQLGLYNRALSSSRLPVTELLGRLYSLVFATFARIRENPQRSRKAFRKLATAMAVPIYLALAWLWTSAEPFIRFLYGEKWLGAVPAMRILLLAAAITTLRGLVSMYAGAVGQAGRQAVLEGVSLAATALFVTLGLQWGLEGAAWGIVARNTLGLALAVSVILPRTGVRARDLADGAWPAVLAGACALLAASAWAPPPAPTLPPWAGDVIALAWNGAAVAAAGLFTLFALRLALPQHSGLSALWDLAQWAWGRLHGRTHQEPAT
ncbi:oligosaccharide flippase family protein [Inmirania thermothiophila]|uniref:O-antigen/teichoic acid export membrane protein n=1 Tax=Inmirania thermothiophila TaxID=1750597 RepID=A0A3N1XXH1_9GAMM|nr:oligosaccharide flippase family protein [Inmirania thermothiophila]ROR29627.1 O-antigen/teichoic acid export membrane protein [Inmirania thermothiophila]